MSHHVNDRKIWNSKYKDNFRDPSSTYITEMSSDSLKNPDISVIGIPYDGGILSHRRGTRLAPDYIRKSFYNFTNYCSTHETELSGLKIKDFGDLELTDVGSNVYDQIQGGITRLAKSSKVAVILGGDHSITLPSFRSTRGSGKEGKDMNLLVIDQHYDVRDYDSVNSGSWLRHLLLDKKAKPDSTVILGSHGFRYPESYARFLKDNGVKTISGHYIHTYGIEETVKEVISLFGSKDHAYLSVDIDAVDQAFAPACSGSSPGGLMPYELLELVRGLSQNFRLEGIDITEYSPPYDIGDITQKLAASVIMEFLCGIKTKARF
ncbi:MAG: agmatinase family protein [Thermoplasmata archaeon]